VMLDHVLSGFRRGNLARSGDDIAKFYEDNYMTGNNKRSAMAVHTFEVTKYNVMQLFEINNQIIAMNRSSEALQQNKDEMHKAIAATMSGLTWAYGREGVALSKGTAMEKYDESAAELRDDELAMLSAGEKPSTIEGIEKLKMPEPQVHQET